jgi:excisionase family DNA binding protein
MESATEHRLASVPSLDDIARDPGCARGLPARTLAALQSRTAAIQAALAAAALDGAADMVVQAQPAPSTGLLTTEQMAAFLKVKESWVASEARAGRIPKRMVGRYVRFDPIDVERALAQRRVV